MVAFLGIVLLVVPQRRIHLVELCRVFIQDLPADPLRLVPEAFGILPAHAGLGKHARGVREIRLEENVVLADLLHDGRVELGRVGPSPRIRPYSDTVVAPSTKVKTKLIDQIEQPAVLEDQAPTRTGGGRVVQPPGVVVDVVGDLDIPDPQLPQFGAVARQEVVGVVVPIEKTQ